MITAAIAANRDWPGPLSGAHVAELSAWQTQLVVTST